MDNWQPIETAPKGIQVLIFYRNCHGKGRTIKAHYINKFTEESFEDFAECNDNGDYFTPEGWYEDIDNWDEYSHVKVNYYPTHWMSLPKPPEGE